MSPIRSKSNLFLKSPNTYGLTYLHRGEDGGLHKGLNAFKECAMTGFSVDYTPTGNYATYSDGTPVQYQICMTFNELEPIFNDEYDLVRRVHRILMSNYFNQIPDFDYVSRLPDAKISDYITVKNLFKRGKLREDIFQDISIFTKYQVKGDDRPDNVAYDFYGDSTLDWLVLTCNNIINVYSEWPMTQFNFENYLLEKYLTYDNINAVHHYETTQVTNTLGAVIVPAGLEVDSNFSVSFFDDEVGGMTTKYPVSTITNYNTKKNYKQKEEIYFYLNPDI